MPGHCRQLRTDTRRQPKSSIMAKRILALFDVDGTLTVPRKVCNCRQAMSSVPVPAACNNRYCLGADCFKGDPRLFAGTAQGRLESTTYTVLNAALKPPSCGVYSSEETPSGTVTHMLHFARSMSKWVSLAVRTCPR